MVHIQAKVRTNNKGKKYTRYIVRWTPPGAETEDSKSFEQRGNPRKPGTAEHFEAQLKESIRNYGYIDPALGQTALKSYAEKWRDRAVNINTRRLRQDFIDDLGALASKTLVQIQAPGVREWLDILVINGRPWVGGAKLSPSTAKLRLQFLRTLLNIAVNDEILPKNPTRKIEVPVPPGFQPTKVDLLTPGEVFALLDEFNQPFSTMFRITVDAGLRVSEVAGLRVCDIDLDLREIHVVQQVDKAGSLAPVKNYKKRTVEMPDDLHGPLKEYLATIDVTDRERVVFLTLGGKPYKGGDLAGNMRRTMRRLTEPRGRWADRSAFRPRVRKQASTGHKFTWHDGRHFYVSLLIAQGVDVAQVRAAVGHSSSKVTLDIYTHLWPRPSGSQRSAVDAVMNRSAVPPEQDGSGKKDDDTAAQRRVGGKRTA